MKSLVLLACVLLAGLLTAGCDSGVFDNEAAKGVIESAVIPLGGEQVLLTSEQITCGEKKGLWIVNQIDGGGAVGRLQAPGRDLGFGDDVRMGDRRFSNPYIQLRDNFKVKVAKIESMTDADPGIKTVTAKLGVVVDHACLTKPLPLLGISQGDFSEDELPRLELRNHDGWSVNSVLH